MPMSRYNVVQTGAKTQLGGVNDGLVKVAYQEGMEGVVKRDPIKPASWQITMLTINFTIAGKYLLPILFSSFVEK
jgi:hypothetical protein